MTVHKKKKYMLSRRNTFIIRVVSAHGNGKVDIKHVLMLG